MLTSRAAKFCVISDSDQSVSKLNEGLPSLVNTPQLYSYSLTPPARVHMMIASAHIIEGLMKPKLVTGVQVLELIPKRLDHQHTWSPGTQAWGIRSTHGWSLIKTAAWLSIITVIGLAFFIFWLAKISKTDLQNAAVPMMFLVTMLMLVIGVPQFLRRG